MCGYAIILYYFLHDFFCQVFFLQQLYCFQYHTCRAAKARLTENGISPGPNLFSLCSLPVSQKKANIDPNLF